MEWWLKIGKFHFRREDNLFGRKAGEPMLKTIVKHGGGSVMVWRCLNSKWGGWFLSELME